MVGIHHHALSIQEALPLLASLIDSKELFVNNGPVAFHRRVFSTKTLYQVQLPIGVLQKHSTNRVITCIRVNYEFLVQSQ